MNGPLATGCIVLVMGLIRLAALSALLLLPAFCQSKRPIAFSDFDGWKSIQSQELSRDGKYVAYALMPQVGDGEVVLRELASGRQIRVPIGTMPPRIEDGEGGEERTPAPRGPRVDFSGDGRYLFIGTFPPKATPKEKTGPAIVEVGTGKITRIDDVQTFAFPEDVANAVAYRRTGKGPSELVVRPLPEGAERKFADVNEFSFTRDGKVVALATKEAVMVIDGELKTLTTVKAPYAKLTWDMAQNQLAFVSKKGLFGWKRGDATAAEWAKVGTSDRANVQFSRDGARIFFGTTTERPARKEAAPSEEKAVFDLWHYQDDRVQTIQKVRATQDRNRSYRAVFHIAENKLVQLGSAEVPEVTPSDDGLVATAVDDLQYRKNNDWDDRFSDFWVVDTVTGERRMLARKTTGAPILSPDGKSAVYFSKGDWWGVMLAKMTSTNLTDHLKVKFASELHDSPGGAGNYGNSGWTKDSRYFLANDRFDVWALTPDAATAKNVTEGLGRKEKLQFRIVRLRADPRDRGVDPAESLLLRAENEVTRETGFYRDSLAGDALPQKLMMGPKNFRAPTKARNADVLLTAATTFSESPDLLITNSTFSKTEKITNANPQQETLAWGKAEMMSFTNLNGVPLQGVLIKPPDFDPAKKYPLMVYIYERLSQTLHTFTDPAPSHRMNPTLYASNGYVVLMPDIAYTVGYPGQSGMNAVLPAVQKIVDQGYIDEKRIGIQGHSWGGYQIAYMVTKTNRFRAAAPGALVGNMFSAYSGIRYGTGIPRQFQYERTQSRIGGSIWQYPLRFLENSPVFEADRVETPILMLHNDGDDAVPWTQGIEFFLALRRMNKEAYFFNYNGEPHGIRKRANQKDYSARMFQFFGHYLKGDPKPEWMEKGIPYLERDDPKNQAGSLQ